MSSEGASAHRERVSRASGRVRPPASYFANYSPGDCWPGASVKGQDRAEQAGT